MPSRPHFIAALAVAALGAAPATAAAHTSHRVHQRAHRRAHHRRATAHVARRATAHTARRTTTRHGHHTTTRHGHRTTARSATHGCAGADLSAASTSAQTLRDAVVCLVNQERASHHLPVLREQQKLDRSAQRWTDAMVSSGSFSHTGNGGDPGSRVSAAGYSWWAVGENIATGYQTPRQVFSAWMASGGHCRNILSPDYSDIGTGVSGEAVTGFGSGGGTWTQDFGRPAETDAPSGNWGPADACPHND
jgi:uncharacterized protein YkwD